jgi:glutamine---fructose-6-phosphate transaminase (isomerizing)
MCGIFAVLNDNDNQAARTVLNGLKKLEYRGYDSWGIALKADSPGLKAKLLVEKHVGKIGKAETKLPEGKSAVGHTRWATHGGVTNENAHPHLDCQKRLAVIHNGIIENYQSLKNKLKNQSHKFCSETDSEVIAHLIEEEMKSTDIKTAVFNSFKKLAGLNAIVVLDAVSNQIIGCRYGSPLVAGISDKQYFLASDVTPFLNQTKKAVFIKDGQGAVLSSEGFKIYNLKTLKKISPKVEKINWQYQDGQKNGYRHFLIKEIMEQKKTIAETASLNESTIKTLVKNSNQFNNIVMFACGTAYYCTLAAKYYFADTKFNVSCFGAYEFLPFADNINNQTLAIAVSQSGETADTLIAAKKAKQKKAHLLAVINAQGSSLERLADTVLKVEAGPEIAVVSTKAFTAQLASLYILSQALNNKYLTACKKIKQLKKILNNWLNKDLQLQVLNLAKTLLDKENIYLIGKYLNYPGALEFALKLKETSYIHAEAFASGELKHGVISLIQKQTPCVVLASNNHLKSEIISSALEIKSRGGKIIGIAPFKSEVFDQFIETPDLAELTIFANVIVGQLLGYFLAVGRGADPDKPRNLAKSVTVK